MELVPPQTIRKPQILVVDDEVAMVRSLELLLRSIGDVHKAYSVPEAEASLQKIARMDCIVTDVSMPEATGLELLEKVRKRSPEIPVIVMTAYSSVPQAVEAMHLGAFEYVVKPFENNELVDVVKRAIEKKGIREGETKSLPTGWICNSRAMIEFLQRAKKVLENESNTVLLLGEVGVGKSRCARWLHDQSPRAKKEFMAVDGRAHEEDSPLLTRSLSKVGTVFIAEVFSLSKRLQDKVVEILNREKIALIVGTSSAPELQRLTEFREDLYNAISALTLKIPPLSERLEDFEGLSREILRGLASKVKVSQLELEASALLKLKSQPFAGNVKELERVLERAALEARSGVIPPEAIHFEPLDLKQILPFSIPIEDGWNRLELLRESLERELILRALEKYPAASNTQIAVILGTTRRILELRMKAYQIRETS